MGSQLLGNHLTSVCRGVCTCRLFPAISPKLFSFGCGGGFVAQHPQPRHPDNRAQHEEISVMGGISYGFLWSSVGVFPPRCALSRGWRRRRKRRHRSGPPIHAGHFLVVVVVVAAILMVVVVVPVLLLLLLLYAAHKLPPLLM